MGRFDSRNSEKMTRRKGQQKKKERLARRAEATKAARKAAPKVTDNRPVYTLAMAEADPTSILYKGTGSKAPKPATTAAPATQKAPGLKGTEKK